VMVASLFTIFMKMVVKYTALYSLTLYAATLPLIIQTILEAFNHDVRFDTMFIIGTLTYVVLILKYIKDEIMKNLD
jgi:multidrug efflux pump subunit AcrB